MFQVMFKKALRLALLGALFFPGLVVLVSVIYWTLDRLTALVMPAVPMLVAIAILLGIVYGLWFRRR